MSTAVKTPAAKKIALPTGIVVADLKWPSFEDKDRQVRGDDGQFDIWYTEKMGWCIPTLRISGTRPRGYAERTYAVMLDGGLCRICAGPHVLKQHTVYIRESRKEALQKFIDIRHTGAVSAHETRDRISTRRARTVSRRSMW